MADDDVKQRLAAILAADVAGYSRLMGEDEPATVAALREHRELFRQHIEANAGRVVDMAGDSVLAVFDATAGAVAAAMATQKALGESNAALPAERRMRFRIGVNLGDIREAADGTVYGDGVNVAARLEGLAAPGGICVSDKVHAEVRGKLDLSFADLGEHQVKNIAEPVRAYGLLAEGETAPARRGARKFPAAVLAGVAAVLALAIVIGVVFWPSGDPEDPILAMPSGPTIAVLPFDNMSGDPEQEYFSDGITEEIITELSRRSNLFVIARNSTFRYKGQSVDVRQVGQELGARYVLEGSVRKSGGTIRVTVQLVAATDGTHLWTETYERELSGENLFDVQDQITENVVGAIGGGIRRDSSRRPESLQGQSSQHTGGLRLCIACHIDAQANDAAVTPVRPGLPGNGSGAGARLRRSMGLAQLHISLRIQHRIQSATQRVGEGAYGRAEGGSSGFLPPVGSPTVGV